MVGVKYRQPIVGSLIYATLHYHRYHDMMIDLSYVLGDGVTWTGGIFGSKPCIFIGADPTLIEHILKNAFSKYEKGQWFRNTLEVLLGEGIFNSDGLIWQKQRKIASHMFTARSIREDMSDIFLNNGRTMIKKMERLARERKVFDIQDLYFRFTLDSFSEFAFGESAGCLSDGAALPFAQSWDAVQALLNDRFFVPTGLWKCKRLFQMGSEKEITRHIEVIKEYGFDVIERTKRHNEENRSNPNNDSTRTDLLTRFITYAEESNQPLPSNAELLDVVLNFIIAGRDTTACLLSWATYELTQHPDLQRRLFEESRQFSFDSPHPNVVRDLPLLHAFVMETLRLHPPVPQDTKECIETDTFPTGQTIPAGTMVVYSSYLMGRSKKLWGEDADEFKIERWFEADTGKPIKEPSPFKMPVVRSTFDTRKHECEKEKLAEAMHGLGKSVAILETTMMLSMAIQKVSHANTTSMRAHMRHARPLVLTIRHSVYCTHYRR